MTNLMDQTLTFLVTPPGNLLYHLVLIFSVTSFLQAGFGLSRKMEPDRANRLRAGGILLLLIQIILFFNSAFAWQGISDASLFLPPVDRSVITLSFIWILWMWVFPAPARSADWIAIGLSISVIALLIFSVSAWSALPESLAFNNTLLDWSWSVFYTILLISGVLLVLIHKPSGWGLALLFLNINLLGTLAHMLWASPNSDFSAALRISLLCSFPLLPGIVFRQVRSDIADSPSVRILETNQRDPISNWIELYPMENAELFFTYLSKLISQETDACSTFWLRLAPENQAVLWGFNRFENQPVAKKQLPAENLRAITKALLKSQATLLETNPLTRSEFDEIRQLLNGLDEIEKLYIDPIHLNQTSIGGFVIAFPPSEEFTPPSEALLERIKRLVTTFQNRNDKWDNLQGRSEALERELSAAHHHLNQQQREINRLNDEMKEFNTGESQQPVVSDDAAAIFTPESLQAAVTPLSDSSDSQDDGLYSLDHLLDQVIDETSLELLEKNVTLRFNFPENLAAISIDQNLYTSLFYILKQLAKYSCDAARENGSLQLQISGSSESEKEFLLEITVDANQHFLSAGEEATKIFNMLSEIIAVNSDIRLRQSMNGNFLTLNVVLSVL